MARVTTALLLYCFLVITCGMPSILPDAMFRNRVVLPAPLCPSRPYFLPRCRNKLVLCNKT